MGDPAGIGPEICAKFLARYLQSTPSQSPPFIPIVLGDLHALRKAAEQSGTTISEINIVDSDADPTRLIQPTIVDFETPEIEKIVAATESAAAGDAAWSYINQAIVWSLDQSVEAVTTGPINKMSLALAGINFPGHTEIFADKTRTGKYCMLQYSQEVTCAFVTTHIGYGEVLQQLNSQRVFEVIELAADALEKINGRKPRMMACGLNPHAGEHGLFGNLEEETIILPAIDRAKSIGIDIAGPFPPDTCFIPSNRNSIDCFICMYHDQGHIPLKALAFDKAVNVTLGLPVIRTSVDHGTAFDIVGQNKADPCSLLHAVQLGARLASSIASKAVRGI